MKRLGHRPTRILYSDDLSFLLTLSLRLLPHCMGGQIGEATLLYKD